MTLPLHAVYGAGGCGRGIMPLARIEHAVLGLPPERLIFIDDGQAGMVVNGHEVMSWQMFLAAPASSKAAAIAISGSRTRAEIDHKLRDARIAPWTIISRQAIIFDDVLLGEGALLSPFVTLTSNIRIGRHFHANLNSYVEHDCVVGDFVTLAPGAKVNGNIHLEDHVYVGSGAVIRQGRAGVPVVIGKGAVIGMGAVVLGNVAPNKVVIGNPARSQS